MGRRSLNLSFMVPALGIGGGVSAFVLGIYALSSSYENTSDDLHFITQGNDVVRVDGEGSGIAWGLNSVIQNLPSSNGININEDQLQLFSIDGEEFTGGISLAYEYDPAAEDNYDPEILAQYQSLLDKYGDESGNHWYYRGNDPIRSTFYRTVVRVAEEEFAKITSEEYIDKKDEIRQTIIDAIWDIIKEDNLPIDFTSFDMKSVKISEAAQLRISQNLQTQRQGGNTPAAVSTGDAVDPMEFTQNISVFFEEMTSRGFSNSEAMEAYCMHVVDNASREGRTVNMNCLRPDVQMRDINTEPEEATPAP